MGRRVLRRALERLIAAVVAIVALAITLAPAWASASARVPTLAGPVVDVAGLLSSSDRTRLEDLSRAARAEQAGQGVELQFLIVSSLDGEPIEDFSIRVAEAWKIGSKGKDNGVLVVVSRDDRAVRIEVGGGLEGGLTDAQAGRIIRQTIVPAFRAGHHGDGLYQAATQVLGALGALPVGISAPDLRDSPAAHRGPSAVVIAIGMLAFIFFLSSMSRRGGGGRGGGGGMFLPLLLGGLGGGSGWGRGSGGGRGGFGGGGWGGGGGGFSGGGASGKW